MRVRNVHVREIAAPAEAAGALLADLGGPRDVLWPSPQWAAIELDQPLRIGSGGGHGPIRYHVTDLVPGRRIGFTVEPGIGLRGTHTFTVEPLGPQRCLLRHEIDGHATGAMRLHWVLVVRWLHDAVVEDLLDRAERALGTGPGRANRWSPWVRLVRGLSERPVVRAVPVPVGGLLDPAGADAADAFAVDLQRGLPVDPQRWADAVFRDPPPVVLALLGLRQLLVGLAGIERGTGAEFDTCERGDGEVLLGADAGHLDFRCVVRREPDRLVVATGVWLHGFRGRLYWAVVRRFHPPVVRAMLRRAVRRARVGDAVPAG
ncbi:DUF2867 domain-containing protein [Pseudonocardia sp. HH130630-07]|uniref:DUF2867 domain-containing protein n=1 Tax=Pseudonocardia sp. HH130630-07 TaxID=1690815 RepID=UPI000814C0A9|nr:DUF2867 domain-containing protein [Pseudonocardia sp. HH130630-07]ANY06227.1 hypothetical protein AFB00_07860 [Pseudonocardia sp. HH130630-07]